MIRVLVDEKTTICSKCKAHLLYEKKDIQKKEVSYMVYGCEENWEQIRTIRCPKCGNEINVE